MDTPHVDPLAYAHDADDETLQEISRLDAIKNKLMKDHDDYLEAHPEVTAMLDDFVRRVLLEQPKDVYAFARKHFGGVTNGLAPVVIAGPSGVGKGTIIRRFMESFPDKFGFSCSHTTRGIREGEEDGVHYHFTNREAMEEAIGRGEFIEHAEARGFVHGNLYGTSVAAVKDVAGKGKVCVLDIDMQGVRSVKKSFLSPKPLYVFVAPPSLEVLEHRLRERGTEDEEAIQRRLDNSKMEVDYGYSE
ncbi:unnamed protein product, partial [Discosporangium mesarthrocarpum]